MSTVMEARATSAARFWFVGVALVAATIALVGFAPTFYLRPATLAPLPTLLIVHGTVFTSWIALLVAQTTLVASDRRDLHRKLGVFGAALAILIPALGMTAAINSMRLGHTPVEGLDPRSFFALPFRGMLNFTILAGCALAMRRDLATHKRLMVLATFSILDAALARWPVINSYGPPAFFAIQDLLVAAVCVHDWRKFGRVHKAYKWGGALVVLTQPLFLALSGSPPWLALASWIRGF
jgi:hypothetical protein